MWKLILQDIDGRVIEYLTLPQGEGIAWRRIAADAAIMLGFLLGSSWLLWPR